VLWDIGWWEPDLSRAKKKRTGDAATAEAGAGEPAPAGAPPSTATLAETPVTAEAAAAFDADAELHSGELKFILHGEKLSGSWTIVQMKGRGEKNWLLIKHKDETSRPGSNLPEEAPLSVASGRGIEEVAQAGKKGGTAAGDGDG
jgi:hypothetical protein